MAYKLSQASLSRLENIHPKLAATIKCAITDSPFDFIVVQGFRTAAYQNELYQQGRTTKGPRVTNCDGYIKKSNHQGKSDGYGYAVDFGIYDPKVEGNIDWKSVAKYQKVARHIELVGRKVGIKISWGGDWKSFKDNPHVEIVKIVK